MMPCVRVENCGYKIGLNGVKNDRIQFNQVRFPSENLLNRFGDIDKYGKYSSEIKNSTKRFFAMLEILAIGRVSIP